jgi:hypothetical protein
MVREAIKRPRSGGLKDDFTTELVGLWCRLQRNTWEDTTLEVLVIDGAA